MEADRERERWSALPLGARVTIVLVAAAAVAAAMLLPARSAPADGQHLLLLGVLVAICAAGNVFEVFLPRSYSFQPNGAYVCMAAVLLPPWGLAIVAVASFVPAVVLRRSPWFKATFNAANYAVSGLGMSAVAGGALHAAPQPADVVQLALGAVVFAALNHVLIVTIVVASAGGGLLRHAQQALDGVRPDIALAVTGTCFALLWVAQPVTLLLVLGPTWLVYRGLTVTQLTDKTRMDPKTGLANFEHFCASFDTMLAGARRAGRPLGLVMLDLDHLRELNNVHGHLAGDRAILAIAEVLADTVATRGVAARFGGEEFCLLLPGASADEAAAVAEDVRRRVAAQDVDAGDGTPLTITVSAGVAAFPAHGDSRDELIEAADVAVYAAKHAGRNRVRAAPPPAPAVVALRVAS